MTNFPASHLWFYRSLCWGSTSWPPPDLSELLPKKISDIWWSKKCGTLLIISIYIQFRSLLRSPVLLGKMRLKPVKSAEKSGKIRHHIIRWNHVKSPKMFGSSYHLRIITSHQHIPKLSHGPGGQAPWDPLKTPLKTPWGPGPGDLFRLCPGKRIVIA
jgi:hypothetical protein